MKRVILYCVMFVYMRACVYIILYCIWSTYGLNYMYVCEYKKCEGVKKKNRYFFFLLLYFTFSLIYYVLLWYDVMWYDMIRSLYIPFSCSLLLWLRKRPIFLASSFFSFFFSSSFCSLLIFEKSSIFENTKKWKTYVIFSHIISSFLILELFTVFFNNSK